MMVDACVGKLAVCTTAPTARTSKLHAGLASRGGLYRRGMFSRDQLG